MATEESLISKTGRDSQGNVATYHKGNDPAFGLDVGRVLGVYVETARTRGSF